MKIQYMHNTFPMKSWGKIKPTDKPHSKLDVLLGETRAGTQSPTVVLMLGQAQGPFGQIEPEAA